MLTKVSNREMTSDLGYSIKIEGMFRLIYSEGSTSYQIHVEPLEVDRNGHNMMLELPSIKMLSAGSTEVLLTEDDESRIVRNLLEGLALLGVKPWIPRK